MILVPVNGSIILIKSLLGLYPFFENFFSRNFEKSDSAETAEISPSQETVGTLDTAETVETGETVIEGGDRSRLRKTLMCLTGQRDSEESEEKQLIYARPSQGTFEKFPHYFREA